MNTRLNKKRGDIVQTSLIKYKSTTSFIQKLLLIPKYWIIGFLRKKKIEFTINKKEKKTATQKLSRAMRKESSEIEWNNRNNVYRHMYICFSRTDKFRNFIRR